MSSLFARAVQTRNPTVKLHRADSQVRDPNVGRSQLCILLEDVSSLWASGASFLTRVMIP